MKRKKKIPLPGQRIVRTVISVWLCFGVYLLRGKQGLPIFSAIAVLAGIQPYVKNMVRLAKERVQSTLIGAAWGLVLITLELLLTEDGVPDDVVHYLLVGLFTGGTIYSTVLLRVTGMASLSAVVFLSIAVTHTQGTNVYVYAFNRLLDTVIGLLIAEVVNRVQLPRRRDTDTLFVSGLGHTILREDSTLSAYAQVELNRLIEDGAKFTISTQESQATVRELMQGVELPYPIITLDGAALYDMGRREYVRTVPMGPAKARQLMTWARENDLPFFYCCIQDDLLVVRYARLANEAMRVSFEKRRPSVYRNYLKSPEDVYDNVIYISIMDRAERIREAREALSAQPWAGQYRVDIRPCSFSGGYAFLRVYDVSVSRAAMLRELEKLMGTKKTVTFGAVRGQYDVVIEDADRNAVVKEVRRRFEPVDLRCWRTIFRR